MRIYNWGTQPRGGEPERTAIHGPKPQPANGRHALGARLDQAAPRQGKQPASEKQNQQTSHKGPGKQRQTGARRQGGGSKASDKQATPGRDPRGKQTARVPQQSTALPQGLLSAGLPPNLAAATHCTKGSRSSQPKPRPQTCCASPIPAPDPVAPRARKPHPPRAAWQAQARHARMVAAAAGRASARAAAATSQSPGASAVRDGGRRAAPRPGWASGEASRERPVRPAC